VASNVGRGSSNGTAPARVTSSHLNNSNNGNRSSVKPQRKCWICSSASHLQSNCPERPRAGASNVGRPLVHTSACKVPDADANTPDDVTALMNVQVNRCVVETQRYDDNHSMIDWV